MKTFNFSQSGFSLVETLVAISLLLIIIVGPMTISSKAAKSSSFASEQVQAFFLAQEGLELAQKIRDDLRLRQFLPSTNSNYLSDPWGTFTDSSASGLYRNCFKNINSNGCGLMWSAAAGKLTNSPITCGSGVNSCRLYKNIGGVNFRAYYSYWDNGGVNPATPFVRKIYFDNPLSTDPDREIRVRSEVTWRTGSIVAEQKVEVDTYLYNTYDNP